MSSPLNDIERKFYTDYLEFQKILEFRFFDLKLKTPDGRAKMMSKYATCIEDVEILRKLYDNERYIVYVSSNTRERKSRKDKGVKYRRTFYIDIEAEGEKPPLSDKVYYQKLLDTALYIWNHLRSIKLEPNYLGESGRGLHIGVKIMPLTVETHDARFKAWYKDLIGGLMKNRPHEDIKFDDPVINVSRIQSCPGFSHNKYPEKPPRRVLQLYTHQNNLLPFLNRLRGFELKKKRYFPKYRKKYNDKTFYKSPEWLLVANHPDLPEGEIHSKIWLMIKCLARDNGIDIEELQQRANELGYNEFIDVPNDDIQYNPWTAWNWAFKNVEYCFVRKIVLPFPFNNERYVVNEKEIEKCPYPDFPIIPLDNFADVLRFIRSFNKATAKREGEKLIVFRDLMWEKIKKGVTDEYLYNYMIFLNLPEFISGEYHRLDSDEIR